MPVQLPLTPTPTASGKACQEPYKQGTKCVSAPVCHSSRCHSRACAADVLNFNTGTRRVSQVLQLTTSERNRPLPEHNSTDSPLSAACPVLLPSTQPPRHAAQGRVGQPAGADATRRSTPCDWESRDTLAVDVVAPRRTGLTVLYILKSWFHYVSLWSFCWFGGERM